ncbi:Nicotinate-nucleotide--dimethylbenzimidazole phosphoribosyltransferase [hydrothermal vent metagenome]|uniref:Nicotinate-nucleotide--dimethylbenzimidazole phosphoribosyltransferase n=1 Tax=hydrothermal vent metagenome TaxID=652676 RepID=A0A3B0ZQM8_9ZZZZ
MNEKNNWLNDAAKQWDQESLIAAQGHQAQLTKPPGALGLLEDLAVNLAAMQGRVKPELKNVYISVFAGDHGVTEENISAFPQAVTAQMMENFVHGGAAISVLAEQLNANLVVVDVGVNAPASSSTKVVNKRVVDGTENFSKQAAMSEAELSSALNVGYELAERAASDHAHIFIGGEMGIGNTTSATALAAAELNIPVAQLVGPGTGLDADGIAHKRQVIELALQKHLAETQKSLSRLQYFAGVEIVALVGAYIRCAQLGIPVLVDGFITTVAALYAQSINLQVANWFIYAHQSQEPGHQYVLAALKARPLLDLNMRLGEGSGAAMAIAIIKHAIALHNNMATFEQAGVAGKNTATEIA